MKFAVILLLLTWATLSAAAVESRSFSDSQQQQAYQKLTSELRCLVCQNQNIADSNAELAQDLRNKVYDMLQQGKSEQDIVDYMTERYGDFVLYRPLFNLKTLLLWLGPLMFLLIGLITIYSYARSKARAAYAPSLDSQQQRALEDILQHGDQE